MLTKQASETLALSFLSPSSLLSLFSLFLTHSLFSLSLSPPLSYRAAGSAQKLS